MHPHIPVRAAFLSPAPGEVPQPCLAHAFPQAGPDNKFSKAVLKKKKNK